MMSAPPKNQKPAQSNFKPKESSVCNEEFILRKRLPRSLPREHNDVYITRKTPFKVINISWKCTPQGFSPRFIKMCVFVHDGI